MNISRIDIDDTFELIEAKLRPHRVYEVGQRGVRQWPEDGSLILFYGKNERNRGIRQIDGDRVGRLR